MLNKKILATAVALAFSSSALADVDLDDNTNSQTVTIATESLGNTPGATVEVTNSGALDVAVETGFTTGDGTSNFVRFDLTNAAFSSNAPTLTFPNVAAGTPTAVISQGGGDGDDFVIFEVVATGADLLNDDDLLLSASTYDVSSSATSSVDYGFYDIAADAINQRDALSTESSTFTTVASAVTGDFTDAGVAVATVASGFKMLEPGTAAGETNLVGEIGLVIPGQVVKSGSIKLDGTAFVLADVVPAAAQDIIFEGDFSFGTFTLNDTSCAGTANTLTVNSDEDEAEINADPTSLTQWAFCLTLDGTTDVAAKGEYTITLDDQDVTNTIGRIIFDTTTVEVPYLTTFSSYNQRLYIVNRGSRDALYTISYTTEGAATATPLAASTGTVPAGEVLALKATDIVELTGRTRTAATVEVEAVDADISVASQSVNLDDGSTDTVVHN